MDKFKEYLQDHAADMDIETAPEAVWEKIERRTASDLQHGSKWRSIARYAAAACVLAAVGIGINKMWNRNIDKAGIPETVARKVQAKDSASIATQESAGINVAEIKPADRTAKPISRNNLTKSHPEENKLLAVTDDALINTIENNYAQLVQWQLKKIRVTPVYAEEPAYFNVFIQQFRQIETDEANIKKDIKQAGLDDQLLEQLINVYQEKLNLLKNFRKEINKMNNRVQQLQSASESYFLDI